MAYTVPAVQISQEFTQQAIFADNPLSALILGPNYALHRYAVTSEKASTKLSDGSGSNVYNALADSIYSYPSKESGSIVDQGYVKLYAEDVEAQYFPNTDLGTASAVFTMADGITTTKVKSSTLILQSKNGYARSSVFASRDVAVGDVVEVDGDGTVVKSKVRKLIANVVAATVSTPTNATSNATNQAEDFNDAPTFTGSGDLTDIVISNTASAYVGYVNKSVVGDVYTIEVTTGGDDSAVRFKISSANGVFATKTNVPLASGVLTIDDEGANDVTVEFTTATGTFLTSHKWTVSMAATVVQEVPTENSTYTGVKDLTYKLTITRGGPIATGSNGDVCARGVVTSTDVDSSPTANIGTSALTIGSYGTTLTFATGSSNGSLVKGDIYEVAVTAASDAQVRTIELQDNLPPEIVGASVISLKLSINKSSVQIPKYQDLAETIPNFTTTIYEMTVKSDIAIRDTSLNSVDLPVTTGRLYLEYRAALNTATTTIGSAVSADEIESLLGTIHPDNPLAQGVYDSLLNASGAASYYIATASNDLAGYTAALELAKMTNKIYGLVPLTYDSEIKDLVIFHTNAMSSPESARWRAAIVAAQVVESETVYDVKENLDNWTASVSNNPDTAATDYTLVTIADATLIEDNIESGDLIRINFSQAIDGKTVYEEYEIDEVLTETNVIVATSLPSEIITPVKVQVVRVFSKQEQIDNLAAVAGGYDNRRVVSVFPDTYKSGNVVKEGYFLAATIAGLVAGSVPHQGLTNIELLGPTDLSRAVNGFTEAQLNTLAESGVMIVTQQSVGSTAYIRHQLTTDESSLNKSEFSITRNVDSISYGLQRVMEPFIGIYNRNDASIALTKDAVTGELRYRESGTFTTRAGNQLNGFTIVKMEANATFKDRLDVEIVLDVPYPYNNISIKLIV